MNYFSKCLEKFLKRENWLKYFCLLFPFYSFAANTPSIKWVVYYSDEAPFEAFQGFSLLVLDSNHHLDIQLFLENGKTVLGYLNLGEISSTDENYAKLDNAGLLLGVNENWPDSRMIDVRNPLWTKLVIEQIIPKILFQHFSGIFLDTVDNAHYLETKDPKQFQGMTKAMVNLIKTIRMHYPSIKIMMNRGFELLPDLAQQIDYELAESIFIHAEPLTSVYKKAPQEDYKKTVLLLKDAQKLNPKLKIFTLDYWPINDQEGIKQIYKTQREQGFNPYVSVIKLDQIIPEPLDTKANDK